MSNECMVYGCGKPQATLGPCQEHLDESIAEEERRFAELEERLAEVEAFLANVAMDYGVMNCTNLHHCQCSMARAYRFALTTFEGGPKVRPVPPEGLDRVDLLAAMSSPNPHGGCPDAGCGPECPARIYP